MLFLVHANAMEKEARVRDLAVLQGIPADYLAKIFTKLASAGLVIATEGVRGGFRLARDPNGITVHDVIVAIDGGKRIFECRDIQTRSAVFDDGSGCTAYEQCSIHEVMQQAEQRMYAEFRRHTLADLALRVLDNAPAGYSVQVLQWLQDRAGSRRSRKGESPGQG